MFVYLPASLYTSYGFDRVFERFNYATIGYMSYSGTSVVSSNRFINYSLDVRTLGELDAKL